MTVLIGVFNMFTKSQTKIPIVYQALLGIVSNGDFSLAFFMVIL